ncbi:DeoR/GlpR family DNA-binding transcription regulator [Paenibacillus paridis]|uniref:DeoR/GlpR family DNA-binding transcription regulator n=1 Tax=Paenibacillus paridis TaxID=2583376 RepID=UPI00112370AD|nr:DeoR/GlpR family DNA-binding transcription regulator [Paenibacillus paridis]
MTQEERLKGILEHIKENGKIRIEQICEKYHISRDSARRDLVKLEEARLILRTHGGAVLPSSGNFTAPYHVRLENQATKKRIGRLAAGLVHDGETLFLDASTTVQAAIEALSAKDITAVTNSIDAAAFLGKKETGKVHLLGGEYNAWNRNLTGPQTIAMIQDFRVQTLFLGACAITPDGLSCPQLEEAYVKREMISRADKVYVLAESIKFEKSFLHHVCGLESINILITDSEPPVAVQEILDKHRIEILIVQEGDNNYEN